MLHKYKIFAMTAGIVILALAVFIFVLQNFSVGFINKYTSAVFSKLNFFNDFLSELGTVRTLTEDNLILQEENKLLYSRLASLSLLREENEFLRDALDVKKIIGREIVEASVFSYNFNPKGSVILLNKGSKDGILPDLIVVSRTGFLIGVVSDVFNRYSVVDLITSSDFKTTVTTLNSKVLAIAEGRSNGNIYLSFVSKDDDIQEGEMIITSGDDLIPGGLIIGEIEHININEGSLFKEVRVKPGLDDLNLSRVLVIK